MLHHRVLRATQPESFVEVDFKSHPIRKGNNAYIEPDEIIEQPNMSLYIPFNFKMLLYTERLDVLGEWTGEVHCVVQSNDGKSMMKNRRDFREAFRSGLYFAFVEFVRLSESISEGLIYTDTVLPSVPSDDTFVAIADGLFDSYIIK